MASYRQSRKDLLDEMMEDFKTLKINQHNPIAANYISMWLEMFVKREGQQAK